MGERTRRQTTTGIERALRDGVRGEVDFGVAARALHTMDASNYRRVPLGVVAPKDAADVAAALEACRAHGVPVVARGAGTSIAGQATGTGVVLDFTRHMRAVVAVDPAARTAVVQPGVVLDELRAAAGAHGLTFGPDPSTHSRCTLGGMIGNNSCGSHSVAWGTTADNVRELSVLTYGGEPLRLGQDGQGAPEGLRELVGRNLAVIRTGFPEGLPRRISGYALDALLPERGTDLARAFCGSEGTLGVLTEATVRLVESPPARALAVLGYADESAAADAAAGLLPYRPLTVEGMAEDLVRDPAARAALPRGGAWLFAETGGATPAEAAARAAGLLRAADALDGAVITDPAARRALWRVREDAAGTATRTVDGAEAWPGWEDCAVPPARLGAYLRDFRALLAGHGLRGTPYGHFGDGCIHVRVDFDLIEPEGVRRFRRFSEEAADLVVAHGGSLSGEHGDGQARAELLPKMYGSELVGLFGRFKDLWDPEGGLNPGMLARPDRLDENLRFEVLPRERVDVAFGYPHDGGDFTAAVRRCVGVAKCRVAGPGTGAGVMCPSFRATGEEEHSTRGRARLLHEMLAGEVVTDGWRSTEVRDALDLCLSCKGCRSDCPVGVDMATYKAEFLHHHYEGRMRPAAHYAMGRLPRWLRLAAPFARPLNAAARLRPLAALAKRAGGIAPEREIPELAPETFTRWFRSRRAGGPGDGAGAAGAGNQASGSRMTGAGGQAPGASATGAGGQASGASVTGAGGQASGASVTGAGGQASGASVPGAGGQASGASATGAGGQAPGASATGAGDGAEGAGAAGQVPGAGGPDVFLWPDTFTDHLTPSVGRAAVEVLEAAGLRVDLPPGGGTRARTPSGRLCCGLTYVSTGQLDHARAVMRRTLDVLGPALGRPLVVLEPSCAAALRTDLPELLSGDPRARVLADSVRTFAQALEEFAPGWQPPRLDRPVAGQTHCHQHAVLGDAAERRLRGRAGLTGELSGGCCGLAGNFGFERGHYEVSVACAEDRLLPAVRAAGEEAELLADGFSCRTQLHQLAGRRARHLAEVLAEGLRK
ncbi:FAD-binding and (Fe-S)-binding domain-containing protein [Streptomyces sp. SP18CS02]|uniref:FAD-binding and (Fe-S)-binding domain-containing protein n=1 Tax=Streptomyces sp. SP18CS02 TaxID=3002531 RepID=UPI002E780EB7|nr:FAD-binding and (Fe-S)-binding domain-containing protein [Streptomyces sp. SP18CS02]MEE1755731.1 FAD-binding and (Fe-S)-binding domain-containing protein [Streptomyces sp. SP18CS02]